MVKNWDHHSQCNKVMVTLITEYQVKVIQQPQNNVISHLNLVGNEFIYWYQQCCWLLSPFPLQLFLKSTEIFSANWTHKTDTVLNFYATSINYILFQILLHLKIFLCLTDAAFSDNLTIGNGLFSSTSI